MLKHWTRKNIIAWGLYPLSLLYGTISTLNIKRRAYRAYRSKCFVISVGNINVGGTGKTPLTIAIANYLEQQGQKVAIIGHAYKANVRYSTVVNPKHEVTLVGDEAKQMSLMVNKNVSIIVGKKRIESIKLAEDINADIVILDDGFSATYIKRDFDIVVLDGKVQLGNQFVLPAGPLRELKHGLSRADCMVVLNRQRKLDFSFAKNVFYLKSSISYPLKLKTLSVFAFCGIGMPEKFYNSLNKEGLSIKATKSFSDHHEYTSLELEKLFKKAKANNLQLITTLKDYVKIDKKLQKSISVAMLELTLTKGFSELLLKKITEFADKG